MQAFTVLTATKISSPMHASTHIPGVVFSVEDATALSFAEESFDVTVSNTVSSEHIEPSAFFREQYRVLKKGGICLLLSARHGVQHFALCIAEQSEWENKIWARISERCDALDRQLGICAYLMTEQQLPCTMETYGFREVSVDYIVNHMTPDDPQYDRETAHAMIEAERASNVDAITSLGHKVPDLVTDQELTTLYTLVNQKYDRRLVLYDAGEKQWDTYVSLTMMVKGVK